MALRRDGGEALRRLTVVSGENEVTDQRVGIGEAESGGHHGAVVGVKLAPLRRIRRRQRRLRRRRLRPPQGCGARLPTHRLEPGLGQNEAPRSARKAVRRGLKAHDAPARRAVGVEAIDAQAALRIGRQTRHRRREVQRSDPAEIRQGDRRGGCFPARKLVALPADLRPLPLAEHAENDEARQRKDAHDGKRTKGDHGWARNAAGERRQGGPTSPAGLPPRRARPEARTGSP